MVCLPPTEVDQGLCPNVPERWIKRKHGKKGTIATVRASVGLVWSGGGGGIRALINSVDPTVLKPGNQTGGSTGK